MHLGMHYTKQSDGSICEFGRLELLSRTETSGKTFGVSSGNFIEVWNMAQLAHA